MNDIIYLLDMENPLFVSQEKPKLEITPMSLLRESDLDDVQTLVQYEKITHDFLILTVENIEAIGNYLESRIDYYKSKGISTPSIVEVGAGNGRLTHFLTEKLHRDNYVYDIIPTDDFSWEKSEHDAIPIHANVAPYNNKEAVQIFEPTIVICSMMTPNGDLSADFRKVSSVQEYILLGHRGGTGQEWDTHGEDFYGVGKEIYKDSQKRYYGEPPFVKDGFDRIDIEDVSKYFVENKNIKYIDDVINREQRHHCDSFRRK